MMFVLGLTGPSGAGKSLAAKILAGHGFGVLDADKVARSVVKSGSPCLEALKTAFGAQIIRPDGSLDRERLANEAFSDSAGVGRLNSITHPYIMAQIKKEIDELRAAGCQKAVLDAPALFEAGADSLCNKILTVISTKERRHERITLRDGITASQADTRISAQQPNDFYTGRADFVIENNGTEEELTSAVERLAQSL
jgi:dephospho-CoA kinase